MSARRLSWLGLLLVLLAARASAEPYLAVANGYKCGQCHVNPTGGGERTAFGEIFSQTTLPAEHVDTGTDVWTGAINRFISLGGDGRYQFLAQQVPGQTTTNQFEWEQARVYLSANVIPDRLIFYVDEQVAPGSALNREAWGMLWSADHTWYLKAGQMYLPFGLRLQDQSAFVNDGQQHRHVDAGQRHRGGLRARALGCPARREQRHRRGRPDQQRQAGEPAGGVRREPLAARCGGELQ